MCQQTSMEVITLHRLPLMFQSRSRLKQEGECTLDESSRLHPGISTIIIEQNMDPYETEFWLSATQIAEARVRICTRPVFIVGSPRSGTTILAWSLAKHSHFWTSDESQILWDLFEGGRLGRNYGRQSD